MGHRPAFGTKFTVLWLLITVLIIMLLRLTNVHARMLTKVAGVRNCQRVIRQIMNIKDV